jgi:rubrerythrin
VPDVGFRLFGDSSIFERAVGRSKGAIKGLDDDVKGAQKTLGGLARAAAPAAAIGAAFYKASKWAQELRDEAQKSGKALDDNVAAGARLGDTFDSIGKGVKSGFATAVGWATKQVENLVYKMAGLDPDAFRAEQDAVEKRAKFSEDAKKTDEAIAKLRKESAYASADGNEKINTLLADNLKLQHEMDALAETDLKRNDLREQMARNLIKMGEEDKKLQDDKNKKKIEEVELQNEIVALRKEEAAEAKKAAEARAAQEKRVAGAQGNLDSFKKDRASMSLQELANLSPFAVGVSSDLNEKSSKARDILGLESEANKRRASGDIAGADELFSKADSMRDALAGGSGVKSSEASATAKLQEALKAELTELQAINKKLGGVV